MNARTRVRGRTCWLVRGTRRAADEIMSEGHGVLGRGALQDGVKTSGFYAERFGEPCGGLESDMT